MADADEIVFSSNPMSRSRIVRWMLEEVAAPYRTEVRAFDALKAPDLDDPARGAYFRWLYFAGSVEAAVTARSLNLLAPADKTGMVGYGSFEATMDTLESAIAAVRSCWETGSAPRTSTWAARFSGVCSSARCRRDRPFQLTLRASRTDRRRSGPANWTTPWSRDRAGAGLAWNISEGTPFLIIEPRAEHAGGSSLREIVMDQPFSYSSVLIRGLIVAAAAVLGCATLSACATNGTVPPPSYNDAVQTLEAGCHERDGILIASGATTGRAETDYYCKINGPSSRLPG